jgi:HEAT repeat protein
MDRMNAQSRRRTSRKPEAARFSRSIRLLVVVCALAFPVSFWILVNPANARAAWAEFSRIMPFTADAGGNSVDATQISDASLNVLHPQQQAELLLRAAIEESAPAGDQVRTRAPQWRGRLMPTARLQGLVNTALNSRTLGARAVGVEVELSLNNLAENPSSANALIARIRSDPAARPWGLWMLGALGNRGVEPERILSVLSGYTRDPAEQTRYWAVEGLSFLGEDQSIPPLLDALRGDSSPSVRERAASALGHSGMLTKQQRLSAVPALIEDAGDASLSASTQTLAYRALHDITGAKVNDTPVAWEHFWAENAGR